MKNFLLFILFSLIIVDLYAQAAPTSMYGTRMSTVTNQQLFQDYRTIYWLEDSYVIDGKQVFGNPFLYHEWHNGIITTTDGRVFTGYKLKYDAFHQTVYFSNGVDSLEVNEEIRDFTINAVYPDTSLSSNFINANQLKKEKKVFYYEVLKEGEAGKLLRYNRKFVQDNNKGVPAAEGKKFFDLEVSYFYFDKKKKTVTPLKANGSNIATVLALDEKQKTELKPESLDFSIEKDIVLFFERYFNLVK